MDRNSKKENRGRKSRLLVQTAVLLLLWGAARVVHAQQQEEPKPIADWQLVPDHRLPLNAGNRPGPRIPLPYEYPDIAVPLPTLHVKGEQAVQNWEPRLDSGVLRGSQFALEMLVHDHSDQPVGAGAFLRRANGEPIWGLLYRYRDVSWTGFHTGQAIARLEKRTEWRSAFDRYWRHIVLSVDSGRVTLWYNGELAGQAAMPPVEADTTALFVLSSFTRAEPLMKLEDLVHRVRVYDRALGESAVRARFDELCGAVHRGLVYPGTFHFNAGPIITHVTTDSATLVFETDRTTTAVVEYGSGLPGDRKAVAGEPRTIHQVRLSGLSASSLYYYRVTVRDAEGNEIHSGDLTLRTASPRGEPITFAVLGDTEARPHVNDRIAKLIWDQRPHFVINLGDVTDGGTKSRKPDWNLEYFLAFTQLHSRVPVFAVPGNGEWGNRELYWYRQYMAAPTDQGNGPGYYSFSYGDADFFMLDSNPRDADFKPGGLQYMWLEQKLARSTARWKIVCHHHPGYTSSAGSSFGGKPAMLVDEGVQPITALYERYGVAIALAGHIHHYERSYPIKGRRLDPAGVIYVTSGGGGGNLQDFAPVRSWFTAMSHRGYHYCSISIDGGRLELRMYDSEGSLRDRLELRK
jgi:hypothetical protein